jgi:hypothetical protein
MAAATFRLRLGSSRRTMHVFAAGACAAACGGDVITLGTGDAEPIFSDAGQSVRNLNLERNEEYDPTLTDDLLEIFFISDRMNGVGGKDVWHAVRGDRTEPFGEPTLVVEASSPLNEESAAVSGDGRTLWVGSRRPGGQGGIDIWRTTRELGGTWAPLEPVPALNSEFDDLPRPPGQGGAVLPIASDRRENGLFQTFLATRTGAHGDFTILDPLELEYLWDASASMEDGFLSVDGLHLFFRRAVPGQEGTLYVTWRRSIDDRFLSPAPVLNLVNSAYDDRDPFVSADGSRFFFASNRRNGTTLDIYATWLYLPTYR